jgi:hypothetical protein
MQLPSLNQRNSLNIDRFDKALVWSALALRSGLVSNPALSGFIPNIKVGHNFYKAGKFQIILEIKLRYDSETFLENGGNLAKSLVEFSSDAVDLPTTPFLVATELDVLNAPNWVDNLEEYCYWTAIGLLKQSAYVAKAINITVNEEAFPDAYVVINAKLDANEDIFFSGYSYVDALDKASSIAPPPPVVIPETLINNASLISNSFELKN